ncbi:ComEC/Rec2 family competence protein [Pontibacter anaerobius]|uniref:ComEC/Rec2 family competence protein n=1 Tax=Pontibacter anaerobius TaxID=2993940 RepID=A0ABT3RJZ8_9BACT|nr:ComEC/Rec2 family competence protein [Pontibacter anaerobius]MCX2741699.1 ComEC/Rec2 family competence protein [Pontibacter anaerobius]
MLRWAPYPFVRITLSFVAGIVLYFLWGRELGHGLWLLAFFFASFLAVAILSIRYKNTFASDVAGILGLLTFMALGFATTHQRTELNQPRHIAHLQSSPSHYKGMVQDYVLQKPGYQSTVLQVQQVKVDGVWHQATGKVQLSVPHDSDRAYELSYGDVLLVRGAPQPVAAALNPNQFNYKAFLANKNIHHRHYLQPLQYQKISSKPSNLVLYYSIQLRRRLDEMLRERVGEKREYAIASALILGVKDELDNSIRQAYADTGTMHVLAVSGLHVGLIYTVLMLVLARFSATARQRWLGAILVLAVLWLYAFITGLSPSVLRAVLMFSLVTVGLGLQRRTVVYNTIAFAALVLLYSNPYNLFEVGFQLSFLAVLGIVYLQPQLYNLLEVDNWLLDKVWAYFTVALAAQLATFPLGLLYFHQFPIYFWLANIIVVPAATFVLWSGVAALAFSWVPFLSELLFKAHFWLIWGMNEFNLWLQRWPQSILTGIDISVWQTWLLYLLMLSVILFLALKRLRYLSIAVGIAALLSVQEIREVVQQRQQRQLVVYSVRGSTGIGLVQGQQAMLVADSVLQQNPQNYTFNVQPHLWQLGVEQPQLVNLHNSSVAPTVLLPDSNQLLVWQGQRWLILSKPPKMQPKVGFAVDYLLLRQNVRLKPEQLQQYTFNKLILDGSNSPWHRQRLRQQLDTLGVSYFDVAESGAFVVEL